MKKNQYSFLTGCFFVLTLVLLAATASQASDNDEKYKGWGMDSAYRQLYDAGWVEKLKVYVKDVIEVEPMPGMVKGVGLVVEDKDEGELYTVHICPEAYMSKRAMGFRKGDKLVLKGCFVDIQDQEVIMAAKIKIERSGKVIKVRLTSNGKPFWAMDEDELKKELAETE